MTDLLTADRIVLAMRAGTKKEAILELLASLGSLPGLEANAAAVAVWEREKLGSTALGNGVALPHGKVRGLEKIWICFGKTEDGVPFDAPDGKPAHLFFLLLAPESSSADYLNALARLASILKSFNMRTRLLAAKTQDEVLAILNTA